MALLSIPREILDEIVSYLLGDTPTVPPPKDLLNLAQTCTLLRTVCHSFMYSTLTTATISGKLERLLIDFPAIASHIRTLTVHAPEFRYADTLPTLLFPADDPPPPPYIIRTPPSPPPSPDGKPTPDDPSLKPTTPTTTLTLTTTPTPPPHSPWLHKILSNCTSLTELILHQPRSRKPLGTIPANFRHEFLSNLSPALLRTITTIRFRDFRVTGLLSQLKALLHGGFTALHTLHVERFSLADPPSFQETGKVARQLEEVLELASKVQLTGVRTFTLDAGGKRPSRLEGAMGGLFAKVMPRVEVVRMVAGGECVYSYFEGVVGVKDVEVRVPRPVFRRGGERGDFCGVFGRLEGVRRVVLVGEVRVCEKMLVEGEWTVLEEMVVKCAACDGARREIVKSWVEGWGGRAKVAVSVGGMGWDSEKVPVEMFGRLGLE